MQKILEKALIDNNLMLKKEQILKLTCYLQSLIKWNSIYNLTAIIDEKEMVYLHILDSLLIAPYLQGNSMLDIGTGAGLPGIPLAILNPEQQWTLLDKSEKKTRFLLQMKIELALPTVDIVATRSEDFHPDKRFDSIVTRAFGSLSKCVQLSKHLLAPNGSFIFMKGKFPQHEIDELPSDITLQDVIPIAIKGKSLDRHLIRLTCRSS